MLLGGIEAGGTKFVYGLADEYGNIIERQSCPTTTPRETLSTVIEYFKKHPIQSLGIGCFGPIDLDKNSNSYGFITTTPKKGWQQTDIVGIFSKEISAPIAFDTDVNGAILGETLWGAAKGKNSALYLTVGTGIGGGVIVDGNLIHGLLHPEMGHILLSKHKDDHFEGICPFHGNCLEGLASGPSIEKRWGVKGNQLSDDHVAWQIESFYLAQAIVNFILIVSPQKIIIGGGVMHQKHLLPLIQKQVQELLNNYIQHNDIKNNIQNYIVTPVLGDNAGLLGAIALGYDLIKI